MKTNNKTKLLLILVIIGIVITLTHYVISGYEADVLSNSASTLISPE